MEGVVSLHYPSDIQFLSPPFDVALVVVGVFASVRFVCGVIACFEQTQLG